MLKTIMHSYTYMKKDSFAIYRVASRSAKALSVN